MGKRKNKDTEYYQKKIRKLQRKLENIPVEEVGSKDSSPSTSPSRRPSPTSPTPLAPRIVPEKPISPPLDLTIDLNTENDQIPEEFLLALGKEGDEKEEVGNPIRPELALRWAKIMADGLGKESRNNLIAKYLTPSNFPNAIAPTMNAELLATLSEPSVKRDKRIVNRQNLTGKLMTCLGQSLTNIIKGNINSKMLIEEINDAAKIAAEIHHQDSSSRKFFALSGANKMIQEAVKNSKTDQFLFGIDCADKIKAAQSIQRTSTLISETKKTRPERPTSKRQLNWRGPPQTHQLQQQQVRGGQHQQNSYKKQPRFDRPRQTDRKRPPVRPKFKQYH